MFRPARHDAPRQLETGYWRAYRDFYRWGSIVARRRGARRAGAGGLRHFAYAGGWKKFEPLWDFVIRARRAALMLPVLETVLGSGGADAEPAPQGPPQAARVNVMQALRSE